MSICLSLPTRGRPESLQRAIKGWARNCVVHNTLLHISYDEDDLTLQELAYPEGVCQIKKSFAPREDSLGAKYNRALSFIHPPKIYDIYTTGYDDAFLEKGWDLEIAVAATKLPNSIGIITAGQPCTADTVPACYALTRETIAVLGWLAPPFFSTWWHDTWMKELMDLTSLHVHADVAMNHMAGRGKTQGLRDLAFWAELFDAYRGMRQRQAVDLMIAAGQSVTVIKDRMEQFTAIGHHHMKCYTDHMRTYRAQRIEDTMAEAVEDDARYARIKANAELRLAVLRGEY